jgi:hypothetical protein
MKRVEWRSRGNGHSVAIRHIAFEGFDTGAGELLLTASDNIAACHSPEDTDEGASLRVPETKKQGRS